MKENTERGGKKKRNYGGSGMRKHGKSGIPHNQKVSRQRVREENERLEAERKLREKRKPPSQSFSEMFPGYNSPNE